MTDYYYDKLNLIIEKFKPIEVEAEKIYVIKELDMINQSTDK